MFFVSKIFLFKIVRRRVLFGLTSVQESICCIIAVKGYKVEISEMEAWLMVYRERWLHYLKNALRDNDVGKKRRFLVVF